VETIIQLILTSGKSAIDLALYILLPVLVVMMALMKVIEARGLLALVARLLRPLLKPFGIPGTGVFAVLQLLLVSFAAPLATLTIMEKDQTARRQIAATLAMIFTMSQANVVFPLVAVGLNLGVIMLTSLIGGLAAAAVTYYLFTRAIADDAGEGGSGDLPAAARARKTTTFSLMIVGGQEAIQIILGAIPILVLAIFLVNIFKATGVIATVEGTLAPAFTLIGFPSAAVLPIVTKYMAGGTAMMGVMLNLLQEGSVTVLQMNRMAGLLINPCDLVGVAVLISAGSRCASVVRPAVAGAVVGIGVRALMHLMIF
jgi:spore maturation protein SpmB